MKLIILILFSVVHSYPFPFPLSLSLSSSSSVRFFMYPDSMNFNYSHEIVNGDVKSLPAPRYKKWNSTVILVHGFGQSSQSAFPQITKNAFLKQNYPANIILVDYSNVTSTVLQTLPILSSFNFAVSYPSAAYRAENIGKEISELVIFLTKHGFQNKVTSTYLIGFSLGAHIVGFSGQHLKTHAGSPIERITGLDPSGPIFQFHPISGRTLDHFDAQFVDVIHTDQARYGFSGSKAHADFYPNGGGPDQPGCSISQDIPGIPLSCAHGRSYEYFTETILGTKIQACRATSFRMYATNRNTCVGAVPFGLWTPSNATGKYYLDIVRNKNLKV